MIAKEPRPGRVKTRLTPPFTPEEAAELAEAALCDTLRAVAATPARRRVLVLDGTPGPWLPPGFDVVPQCPGGLDARLAAAFAGCDGPALLIGMDTPQVTPDLLTVDFTTGLPTEPARDLSTGSAIDSNADLTAGLAADLTAGLTAKSTSALTTALTTAPTADSDARCNGGYDGGYDACFGPAEDGGFWALGLAEPDPRLLLGVPMSAPHTGAVQRARLVAAGLRVRDLPRLRDVDTAADAAAVAATAPHGRFAAALARLGAVGGRTGR
ncbi:DUF2064 domain-containing protein [Streptomyces sp. NPDC059009]|uniref:TIGR04282 family arsenosugar biosynthesis glycosyltransferase n=1 Tax=Streptomyces sp. NPDC059009 TaxID=3346694 RepID=UPI0036D08839